jgi:hypothetical protein
MSTTMDDWNEKARAAMESAEWLNDLRAERNTDAAYLRESVAHADEILAAAIERVNARCGAGTTPELIAAFMQAAATVMAANIIGRSIEFVGSDQ